MNKIELLVLCSTFLSPVLGCSAGELKLSLARTSEERRENWIPAKYLFMPGPHIPHPTTPYTRMTSICNNFLLNYRNARRPTETQLWAN